MLRDYFGGRKVLIASRHGKEEVIAPLLESALGVKCLVVLDIDTDQFGTFSGEIDRRDSPLETVRQKCRWAMDKYGFDLAIASEGSFGPHPSAFFLPADEEWIALIDNVLPLELIVREISTNTNFREMILQTEEQLIDFAHAVHFPSHGLILKPAADRFVPIVKGIQKWDSLLQHFRAIIDQCGEVIVQTDMRAMVNPTRMKVIEQTVEKLINKLNVCCPVCGFPAFDVAEVEQGLPCDACGLPTHEIMSMVYLCQKCRHTEKTQFPDNKKTAYPGNCDFCNP